MTLFKLLYYAFIKRIKEVRLMEFIDYRKTEVDAVLEKELGWKYYGGHHHENHFTRFFQSYYLPQKFYIDKRKTELSALVRSGQISREKALDEIESCNYVFDENNVNYVINKLGLSKEDFSGIMSASLKSHNDYKTYLPMIRFLKWPIYLATKVRLLPHILYLKYAS